MLCVNSGRGTEDENPEKTWSFVDSEEEKVAEVANRSLYN